MSEASAEKVAKSAPKSALDAARVLDEDSGRRIEIPVRVAFVRDDDPDVKPPLARLLVAGGRGGAVPLKLYLALIWRCSQTPFETDILARHWAELLGLEKPATLGARRVTRALEQLEDLHLVHLTRRRGESTIVRLLEESGTGTAYTLPSTAYTLADTPDEKAGHRYFKVPAKVWTEGDVQEMSAAAVAMLLVLLAERNVDGRRTWWSTERFPRLFNLSPSIRSQGTSELVDRRLVSVRKELVTSSPSPSFTRQRVRNTYKLRRHARPVAMIEQEKAMREAAAKEAANKASSLLKERKSARAAAKTTGRTGRTLPRKGPAKAATSQTAKR